MLLRIFWVKHKLFEYNLVRIKVFTMTPTGLSDMCHRPWSLVHNKIWAVLESVLILSSVSHKVLFIWTCVTLDVEWSKFSFNLLSKSCVSPMSVYQTSGSLPDNIVPVYIQASDSLNSVLPKAWINVASGLSQLCLRIESVLSGCLVTGRVASLNPTVLNSELLLLF